MISLTYFRYCASNFSTLCITMYIFLIVPEEGWFGQLKYSLKI